MDILLINGVDFTPGSITPQIGQLILRQILSNEYEVEYVNFDYLNYKKELVYTDCIEDNINLFVNYILEKKPKVVGFYTICNTFIYTVRMAKLIKLIDSSIHIVFGGPHATLTAEACINYFDFVDVIAIGEGEYSILPLMNAFIRGSSLDDVPGIVYRKDGNISINPICKLIEDNELTKYTVYDYSPYEITSKSTVEIEGGRGCPFSCTFCSTSLFWGRIFRIKPIDTLIDEMKEFHRLYGVTQFSIVHDMFTVNKAYIHDFCNRILEEELPYTWNCSSRIDVIDKETILLMKRAHCNAIYLGIETGSKRMQKILNKRLNLDHALDIISYMKNLEYDITLSFIYGFPDETIDDFKETIKMMEAVMLLDIRTLQLHRFMSLPKTIETNKIMKQMYFNNLDVDFSIYDSKLFDEESDYMILNYPKVFIQYYTFDSDVRKNYKRFDFMMFVVASVMGIYNCCTRHMIHNYGLEGLYIKYEHLLEDLFIKEKQMKISKSVERNSFMHEMLIFAEVIFKEEDDNTDSEYFKQILKFERIFKEYVQSGIKVPKIYEFPIDIMEAKKHGLCIEKITYIQFAYEGLKPKISKVKFLKKAM